MPAVVRLGDQCTGHGPWPPRPNDMASTDVFVNSLGAHRQGDHWIVHCGVDCHDAVQAAGDPTVFVNNKQLARIGDPIACGSFNAMGSPNVFSGGGSSSKPGFAGKSFSPGFSGTSDIEPVY